MKMENINFEKTTLERISEKEERLLELIHSMGYGELHIYVADGQPVRAEEVKKSIKF